MFKFKLIGINPKDRTLTYQIYKVSYTKLIIDTLFILFTAGFGLIYYYFEDEPIGYKYLCNAKGYSLKSIKESVIEKFTC